jgi:type IV secretion system protein VirB6
MLAEATGYTQFGERLAIRLLQAVSLIALVVIFLIWIIARVLMGFVIALGPFLIGLALFDATRPFVDRWVGKLMSLTLVQLSVSVMLQMLMSGFNNYVRAAQAHTGGSLDEKLNDLLQVAAWYWCGLFLIKALAIVAYSIGGGLAASFAPQTQAIGRAIMAGGGAMQNRSARQAAAKAAAGTAAYQQRTATATEATAANTAPRP